MSEAEASALKLQEIDRLTNAARAEVAGEFDTRSDKPVLRVSRRHHGNIKSSNGTAAQPPVRACHVAIYQPLTIDLYGRYKG